MFTYTAGDLQGQPELNTVYYIASVQEAYTDDCITFSSKQSFTLSEASPGMKGWDGTLWTSTDKTDWRRWNGRTTLLSAQESGVGEYKLYVRGNTDNTVIAAEYDQWVLDGTAGIACSGNIETLRGATDNNPSPTPMANSCYAFMFSGCTLLTKAPDLPATTLTPNCYSFMFQDCTGLTVAPALPATTLADRCYMSMFAGCTSLTDIPVLPATTLAERCYYRMFYGCSALEVNASAPGKEWTLPSVATATNWGSDMFTGTVGALQGQPALNTTYYIKSAPTSGSKVNPWQIGADADDAVIAWTNGVGKLIVEGAGNMKEFAADGSDIPWPASEISAVEISVDVTGIGYNVWYGLDDSVTYNGLSIGAAKTLINGFKCKPGLLMMIK